MRLITLALVTCLGLLGALGYRLLEATLEADIYRERWTYARKDLAELRDQYNAAVRRTAVTELVNENGRLDVVVRSATGELERLATPFDPRGEIYVDFVVVDGRIWIRRVFDSETPPATGLVIDSRYADIDWDRNASAQGKAAYRALGEGRWVVTVTGDGSLGLRRKQKDEAVELSSAPPVRNYDPIETSLAQRLDTIAPGEVARALGRRLSAGR